LYQGLSGRVDKPTYLGVDSTLRNLNHSKSEFVTIIGMGRQI
jgi:hypothetical protein